MSQTIDFRLQGAITAMSPITISSADLSDTDDAGIIPVKIIRGGTPVLTPIIRGETLKGGLRRAATRRAAAILKERHVSAENPFGLQAYHRNAIGGVKGRASQKPDDIVTAGRLTTRNPIAGIFGLADPVWIAGALEVFQAVPTTEDVIALVPGGARVDDVARAPAMFASLSPEDRAAWLQYAAANREASAMKDEKDAVVREKRQAARDTPGRRLSPEAAKIFDDRIEAIEKQIRDTKNAQVATETIGRPLPPVHAIAQGAVLDHGFAARRLNSYEFRFFLASLETWMDGGTIGGHRSAGYGRFSASYDLTVRISDGVRSGPWIAAGQIKLMPDSPVVLASPVPAALAEFLGPVADGDFNLDDPDIDFGFSVAD